MIGGGVGQCARIGRRTAELLSDDPDLLVIGGHDGPFAGFPVALECHDRDVADQPGGQVAVELILVEVKVDLHFGVDVTAAVDEDVAPVDLPVVRVEFVGAKTAQRGGVHQPARVRVRSSPMVPGRPVAEGFVPATIVRSPLPASASSFEAHGP